MCGLQSVQSRCERGIAIKTFKIISGLGPAKGVKLQQFDHNYDTSRMNPWESGSWKTKQGCLEKILCCEIADRMGHIVITAARNLTAVNDFKNLFDKMYHITCNFTTWWFFYVVMSSTHKAPQGALHNIFYFVLLKSPTLNQGILYPRNGHEILRFAYWGRLLMNVIYKTTSWELNIVICSNNI